MIRFTSYMEGMLDSNRSLILPFPFTFFVLFPLMRFSIECVWLAKPLIVLSSMTSILCYILSGVGASQLI